MSKHMFSAIIRKSGDSLVVTVPSSTCRMIAAERGKVEGLPVKIVLEPGKVVEL